MSPLRAGRSLERRRASNRSPQVSGRKRIAASKLNSKGPSSFLLLVRHLAPSSDALVPSSFLINSKGMQRNRSRLPIQTRLQYRSRLVGVARRGSRSDRRFSR